MATAENTKSATESLKRIQEFDVSTLERREDLGRLSFGEALPAAARITHLFQRISPASIALFADAQVNVIRTEADGVYNLFNTILSFDPAAPNAGEQRTALIGQVNALPEQLAGKLWQHIAYSVASSLDPTATQQEMRAALQQFEDARAESLKEVESLRDEAAEVLERVRTVAAEQGVSQQAGYFKIISEEHAEGSEIWLRRALWAGGVTVAFALISTFTYRMPWIAPTNPIEAIQLISSKIIILGILSYALIVCVRNFQSHKHNAVVNKHRQNALLTYTAFVDAAPSSASREVVLTHAAASVFSPQETGYIKQEEPSGGRSVMEMITRASLSEPRPN